MRLSMGLGLTDRHGGDPALSLGVASAAFYRTTALSVGAQTVANLGTLGGVGTFGDSASIDARDPSAANGGPVTFAPTQYINFPTDHRPAFTATTGSFSCVVAANASTTSGALWDARSANTNGAGLYHSAGSLIAIVGGASNNATRSATWVSGAPRVAGFKVVNGQLFLWTAAGFTAGVSITGVGAITFAGPRIGAYAYGVVLPLSGTHALGAWGPHDWTADQFALLGGLLLDDL